MTTSLRSRPRDTATRSWWTSVLPSPRPSSPTSSTASTTPTSTSPQPRKRLHNQDQRKDYDDEHACKRHRRFGRDFHHDRHPHSVHAERLGGVRSRFSGDDRQYSLPHEGRRALGCLNLSAEAGYGAHRSA